MPHFAGDFPVSDGNDTPLELGQGGLSGVLLGNESGLSIVVKIGANYSRSLYPGQVDFYEIPKSFNGNVILSAKAALNNVISWPSSFVRADVYGAGERPNGVYPASLLRATNNGNVVNTNVTSTNSIKNDGNPPLTNIIEVTPSDAGSSTWLADNSGNLTIKGDNAGVLSTLLQIIAGASPSVKLAAAAILTEVLGTLQVDGSPSIQTAGAVDLIFNTASAQKHTHNFNNVTALYIANDGLHLQNNCTLHALNGSNQIGYWSLINGTGSGTYNHNLGVVPTWVIPIVNVVGSATQGWDSATTSQVHISLGASLSFRSMNMS